MVKVGNEVTRSTAADKVENSIAEMALAKMVYGSQAEKMIGQERPRHDLVARASGATTCGNDSRWAETLKQPDRAGDQG